MTNAVHKITGTETLNHAVLLTTTGVFGGVPGVVGSGESAPLMKIGGLSLFQRAVLTLQRAGIRNLWVLAGSYEDTLRRSVQNDRRVTVAIRWMPVREFPPWDSRTWESLAEEIGGPCLLVGAKAAFSRSLIERLRREVSDGEGSVVVACEDRGGVPGEPRNPLMLVRSARLVALTEHPEDCLVGDPDNLWRASELVVLPSRLLKVPAATAGSPAPIRTLLERVAAGGRIKVIEANAPSAQQWYHEVRGRDAARAVEQTLFRSLKGEFEGFVDTYVNRKASAVLTRMFLALRLSPNAVTMISIVIGLMSAAAFAFGNYAAGILGALLFQLSAIVDCSDGEVARLTFSESKSGEQIDLLGDNVVHMAIFVGIAWGLVRQIGSGGASSGAAWIPTALGVAAVAANAVSLWLVTRAKSIREREGWRTPEQATKVEFVLRNMASRDFSVILLLFALIGRLDWFLWMAAIGSNVFWLMLAWITRPSAIARRA